MRHSAIKTRRPPYLTLFRYSGCRDNLLLARAQESTALGPIQLLFSGDVQTTRNLGSQAHREIHSGEKSLEHLRVLTGARRAPISGVIVFQNLKEIRTLQAVKPNAERQQFSQHLELSRQRLIRKLPEYGSTVHAAVYPPHDTCESEYDKEHKIVYIEVYMDKR